MINTTQCSTKKGGSMLTRRRRLIAYILWAALVALLGWMLYRTLVQHGSIVPW